MFLIEDKSSGNYYEDIMFERLIAIGLLTLKDKGSVVFVHDFEDEVTYDNTIFE